MQTNHTKNALKHECRLSGVRILDGGYCRQLEYLSGWRRLGLRQFHAMFLHFRHPTHGEAVIDTGYSPYFFKATRKLPGYLHRLATPVPRGQMADISWFFARHRIDPNKVKTVFLSHFHADHIGGLCYYPEAEIVCNTNAHTRFHSLNAWQRLRAGLLPELFPSDFAERVRPVDRSAFIRGGSLVVPGDFLLVPFHIQDYWGDGSLLLVDLPGHAEGQLGFILNLEFESIFYVADAYWDLRVLRAERQLPYPARWLQHSWTEYLETQNKLRTIDHSIETAKLPIRLLATHCLRMYEQRASDES